jgi:uncharacterized repeat protein (TIGR01451 family)
VKPFLLVLSLLLLTEAARGQVLVKLDHLSGPGNDGIGTSVRDSNGNTYISFSLDWSTGSDTEVYYLFGKEYRRNEFGNVAKLDPSGRLEWIKSLPSMPSAMAFDGEGNLLIAARHQSYSLLVAKLRPDGTEIWRVTEGTSGGFYGMDIITDQSNNVYVTGTVSSWSVFGLTINQQSCCGDHDFLVKFNSTGTRQWVIANAPNKYSNGKKLAVDNDGNIILAGEYMYSMNLGGFEFANNIGYGNVYLARVSPSGSVLWATALGGAQGRTTVNDLELDTDGSMYITGSFNNTASFGTHTIQSGGAFDFYAAKLTRSGEVVWLRSAGAANDDRGENIVVSGDNLYVTGFSGGGFNIDNAMIGTGSGQSGVMARLGKNDGKAHWIARYGPNDPWFNPGPSYIHEISPGRLRLTGGFYGTIRGFSNSYSSRAVDLFTGEVLDTLHSQPAATLRGKVFVSSDGSCELTQQGIKNMLVRAEPGNNFGLTNDNGEYAILLEPGSYSVNQVIRENRGLTITPVCPPPNEVIVTSVADKPRVDFANIVTALPWISVDASGGFRRCFESDFTIQVCNEGAAAATNVKVNVELPEFVVVKSTDIPWTSRSARHLLYTFPLLDAGECLRIKLRDSVICGIEEIRGRTQCVKISVTPGNNMATPPGWDGSNIVASGRCLPNGFVRMILRNTGTGAMADSAAYEIYRDDLLSGVGNYKLAASDSLVLQVPAHGKTVRIHAMTTPNSPLPFAGYVHEGCLGSMVRTSVVSVGHVMSFPEPDTEPEIETFCAIIIDSFDPNDKQVLPTGITEAHNIKGDEQLEYMVRFQNTGTAEAINVTIRDQLDPALDLSSLQLGLASHQFHFSVEGSDPPELVWKFKNIKLPDSSSNEPGSHGFVKYTIKSLPNPAKGTVIRNKASIIFDFNSPVITNEVFNTVGLPETPPVNDVVVQDCGDQVTIDAGGDVNLLVCDATSTSVHYPQSVGHHYWGVESGIATLGGTGDDMLVEGLAIGTTVVNHYITHCDNTDASRVTILRAATPPKPGVPATSTFCSADIGDVTISATGTNITWYHDAALTTVANEGKVLRPVGAARYFVTDQASGCESTSATADVIVTPTPGPPKVVAVQGCIGREVNLSAIGSELRWYESAGQDVLLHAGPAYATTFNATGEYALYVSQVVSSCESEASLIPVTIIEYSTDLLSLSNVITPNDDSHNQYFFLDVTNFDACLGDFKSVVIFNRLGQTMFTSDKPDFKWDGAGCSPGVYFYTISFSDQRLNGSLSVLR